MEENKQAENKPAMPKKRLNKWKIYSFVLGLLLIGSLTTGGNVGFGALSNDEVGEQALNFINTGLLQGQATATLNDVTTENGLYVLSVNVQGQETPIYVNQDASLMFLNAIPMTEVTGAATGQQPQASPEVPKSDKPEVELFVMSHCPYGTQMEKGILPVAYLLGEMIDLDFKFVYYAMHPTQGEVEEQLRQYCIQEEQEDKFLDYMTCFLEDGDSDRCDAEVGIDTTALSECYNRVDQEYNVIANLEDTSSWLNGRFPLFDIHKEDNEKYGVGGSPTLVINGQKVQTGRDSITLLNTICGAFNEAPEECNTQLEAGQPGPGFGWSTTGSANVAACGV